MRPFQRPRLVAAAAFLLVVVGAGIAYAVVARPHPRTSTGGDTARASAGGPGSAQTATATPADTASATPGNPAAGLTPGSAGTRSSPTAAPGPTTVPGPTGSHGAPPPAASPTPPASGTSYPAPAGGAAPFTAKLLASDLVLPAGQQLDEVFTTTAAGAATLHVFVASSASTYPVNTIRACVESTAQPPCSPIAVPYDSSGNVHWAIGVSAYRLRLVGTSGSAQLAGFSLGWDGTHHAALSGVRIRGGCDASTGYTAGCGLRFELTTGSSGNCTLSLSTPSTLHLKVKNKSSGTIVYDAAVTGSATFPLAGGQTWKGYLYPQGSTAGTSAAAFSISWP